jgi:hypothetical protein
MGNIVVNGFAPRIVVAGMNIAVILIGLDTSKEGVIPAAWVNWGIDCDTGPSVRIGSCAFPTRLDRSITTSKNDS